VLRYVSAFALLIGGALAYRFWTSPEWQNSAASWSAAVVRPILIPIVELIAAPAFVYLASAAIIIAAVAACIMYWRKVIRPRIARLRALRSEVGTLPPAISIRSEQRFEAMQQLGNVLRRQGLFLSAWAAFQGQSARYGRIPEAPFAHFAADDRISGDLNQRGLMHALPGYFTTVGLILTFLGLIVALYFAAKGFRSGNMEEARAAILQLLNASAFKFMTSLAALGSALMISIFLRYCVSLVRRETAYTVASIESYVSEWRDAEGSLGFARTPVSEVSEKIDVLIDAIMRLNEEIGQLRLQASTRQEERL
jgi:hypothetical protein